MEQPGGGHGLTLRSIRKAAIRGRDHGPLLVAGIDEQEEQIAAPERRHRQVNDLIHHQPRGARQEAESLLERPCPL